MATLTAPARPIMRYHGGKWVLAPWILSHFPTHRTYTETFGGGASVLLRKPRCYAEVYNDLDGEIVNVFRVLRNPTQARELARQLRLTPYSRAEFDAAYLPDGDPIELARRTLLRSFMGFGSHAIARNTGFRNYAGDRRTSTPASDWANYPDAIEAFVARLQGVYIESLPAADVLRRYDTPTALHYVDPPYVASTRTTITKECRTSYRFEMTDEQHEELAESLHKLKGMVVLSGYPCDLYQRLYPDWLRVERHAHADSAQDRTEVLWLNPAAAGQQQLRMEVA